MGYDLHITRAVDFATRSAEHPISRQEWLALASTWPGLELDGREDSPDGPLPVYVVATGDETSGPMSWRQGRVTIRHVGSGTGPIARIAEALGAHLLGDDAECYLPDGSVLGWARDLPPLLERPLYVHELAAAWRSRLNWEDCDSEDSVSAQALRVFQEMAVRDVATWDIPDADQLCHWYWTDTFYSRRTFVVRMTRQFTVPDSAGGDVVRVDCELRYPPLPELTELRVHRAWAPAGGPEERKAWLAALADRPEWALLDRVVPQSVTLNGEPIYSSAIATAGSTIRDGLAGS